MVIRATGCAIVRDGRILLIKKAIGQFGAGKWSVLGGKIDDGEGTEQACIREVLEESGLSASNLKYHGVLRFWFGNENATEPDWVVHAFSTLSFEGQLRESSEGVLHWTEIDRIPYEEMWGDNRHWLPLLIQGKAFVGEFRFDKEGTRLMKLSLEIHEESPSACRD
jgi:8-oxo-dGTP pyrophosphatase MutT (NUDIX family)